MNVNDMSLKEFADYVNAEEYLLRFRKLSKTYPPHVLDTIKKSENLDKIDSEVRKALDAGEEVTDNVSEKSYDAAIAASKQVPTDIIQLKLGEIRHMFSGIYDFDSKEGIVNSSDIIFANTIPLKNFIVIVKDYGDDSAYTEVTFKFQTYTQCPVMKINVNANSIITDAISQLTEMVPVIVPFENIREHFANAGADFSLIKAEFALMTIEVKFNSRIAKDPLIIKVPLVMDKSAIIYQNEIIELRCGKVDLLNQYIDSMGYLSSLPIEFDRELHNFLGSGVILYRGINTLLLNPVVMEVFEKHSSKEPFTPNPRKISGKNKRAKIRYVKKHIVKVEDIDKAFEKRGFVRKTMIWYVTGHWREYKKTGRRVFIQGYWKGVLRHLKDIFPDMPTDPRDREIIFNKTSDSENN